MEFREIFYFCHADFALQKEEELVCVCSSTDLREQQFVAWMFAAAKTTRNSCEWQLPKVIHQTKAAEKEHFQNQLIHRLMGSKNKICSNIQPNVPVSCNYYCGVDLGSPCVRSTIIYVTLSMHGLKRAGLGLVSDVGGSDWELKSLLSWARVSGRLLTETCTSIFLGEIRQLHANARCATPPTDEQN